MLKVSLLITLLIFTPTVFSGDCQYKLIEMPVETLRDMAGNIEEDELSMYLEEIENPLIAALLWYSEHSKSSAELRQKIFSISKESMNWYKPSAEIVYQVAMSGKLIDVNKSRRLLAELYTKWSFVRVGLAISTVFNSEDLGSLQESNDVFIAELMMEDRELLYYLGAVNKKMQNHDVANSYFILAAERGVARAFGEVVSIYGQAKHCEDYYEIYRLLFLGSTK